MEGSSDFKGMILQNETKLSLSPSSCTMNDLLAVTSGGGRGKHGKAPPLRKTTIRGITDSLDESGAALLIQRNYRGYRVRKEYGPLVSSSGKLDVETAHFIRHYCHKWKAKSMYQVLLLYRAKRYQDLVHFSQQAHIYNQSLVASLQGTRESVQLRSLDKRPPRDFLESYAEKPNVFKLPFRLQDPMLLGVMSKMDPLSPERRMSLQDEEPWDAPLKTIIGKAPPAITFGPYGKRDQEVQTSLVSLRDCVDEEPQYGSSRNGPTPPAFKPPSYGNSPRETRPPPSSWNQHKYGGGSTTNNNMDHDEEDDFNNANRSGGRARGGRTGAPAVGPPGARKQFNPVAELEQRAQRAPQNDDSDDPPFNFQAMLRKTNYGRASIRRRGSGDNDRPDTNGHLIHGGSSSRVSAQRLAGPSPTPSSGRRSPRRDSPTRRPKELPAVKRRSAGQSSLVTTELAPGIVVRGHVADL